MSVPPEGTESTAGSSGLPANLLHRKCAIVQRTLELFYKKYAQHFWSNHKPSGIRRLEANWKVLWRKSCSKIFCTFGQVVRRESATLLSLVRIQQGAHYQPLTAARPPRARNPLIFKHLRQTWSRNRANLEELPKIKKDFYERISCMSGGL